ncbi:MAG: glycosyltransferase family 4 protein [Phycisphaerales bacterium]|nr:glycosyltransferase family 4 protein [Phycisphaerae bacterium]NNF41973.1 glycosyltransferase family 4 protein [Phycisphaerales bacterium]NNM26786.1 glycosyltransferase family 4 protein [Phycisphaerales bacterium]
MSPADHTRVGYVLKMYPRLAETFILNEILAHEASDLPMQIYSLRSPIDGRFHSDLARVRAEVTYIGGPSVKAEVFWSHLQTATRAFPGGPAFLDAAAGESATDVYQAMLLAEAVRADRVTHLHAHFATVATTVARLASVLTGVPYSFTAHAKDIYHETVVDDDLRRKLRDASAVVTVSDFNLKHLADRYGADAARVERIYNGLDLDRFAYETPSGRPPVILGVGRLVEKKGFADLIDACVTLADRGCEFSCTIVGGGVLRNDLQRRIDRLDIGHVVELLGPRPRQEVAEWMRRAALVAAPCVISENGNRDGLPTVILEAMALGTPCVSTDVTGIPEVVRHGETGLIAPQHDPAALADTLESLLGDEPLRLRLAQNARSLMEAEFDIRRTIPALRSLFGSAAVSPPVELEVG